MHEVLQPRGRSYTRSAVARWHIAALLGLSSCVMACDGPTLLVGERKRSELDASEASDANQARDATRVRPDADADADEGWDDPHQCNEFSDCQDNARRRRCSPFIGRCVECLENRHCFSGRCDDNGLCREPDKPRP